MELLRGSFYFVGDVVDGAFGERIWRSENNTIHYTMGPLFTHFPFIKVLQ